MTNGVLVIARNNGQLDYVKQAYYLALKVKEILNVPTSIITDSKAYLVNEFGSDAFDKIIELEDNKWPGHNRPYFDGTLYHRVGEFKNDTRSYAYDLSPYENTLLLDTDYVLKNDLLKNCFESKHDLMMWKDSHDIAQIRDTKEFTYISDYSIDFYWATCIFFRKTPENKIFFDLVQHIQTNWDHYRRIYQINSALFRNDFAFSIAIHIMNGFQKGNFVSPLPGKHYYIIDKDIMWKNQQDGIILLLEKEKYLGEYTACKVKGLSTHIMNKFSLERCINEEITNA